MTQYVACVFRPGDERSYTFHNDGEPVAPGDRVKIESKVGWQIVTVAEIVADKPAFPTKPILEKMPSRPPDFDKTSELTIEAMTLCLADAGDRPRPYKGEIKCPKCGGRLFYLAKATARGTIWGTCATPGCLQWMV
jgi:hypothetical protein